ncbi:MAG: cobalt transporter CbiM [Thermodesulfovibrionales bacterium]|nr:cobalt transporter CbiM [Thermodesulfovibrionales bacterium]
MHMSEGVLSAPVLGAGAALTVGGLAVGLRFMDNRRVPEVAVVASALFVASLIRFPVGPASVHLTLNGLAGILLGWMAFPAVFVALALQALLFQFGGFTTLGANTTVMALPAVVASYTCRRMLRAGGKTLSIIAGAIAGAIGVAGGVVLIALALVSTEESFKGLSMAFVAVHVPVLAVESAITAIVVAFLWKVKPELLGINGGINGDKGRGGILKSD